MKAYHSDQVFYEKALTTGYIEFESALKVKFLAYQKVEEFVIPFFRWFS